MSTLPVQTLALDTAGCALQTPPLEGHDLARTFCHAGAVIAGLVQPTADSMDRRPSLPPITTHFAEYFPKYRSHNAPVTPPDDSYYADRPQKRKRSEGEAPVETGLHVLEPNPASLRPGAPNYSTAAPGEPERKRLRPHLARDPFHPRLSLDAGYPEHKPPAQLTSPSQYAGTEERDSHRLVRDPGSMEERRTLDRSERTDWLANVRDFRSPESKTLPPLARPSSPLRRRESDERWKGPWRSGSEAHPTPVEPKPAYFHVSPEEKPDSRLIDKGVSSEPSRIPPFTNLSSAGSRSHSQVSDHRHSVSASRHITRNSIHSPTAAAVSPRTRTQHGLSITSPQRSTAGPNMGHHDAPGGYANSVSDSSTVSGPLPTASPPRYTWDGPGLYDHPHRKRRGNLPKESTALLTEWFNQHSSYPYPKEAEKQTLQAQTGLQMSQISNWFVNARRRRRPNTADRTENLPNLRHHNHHHHHHHHQHQRQPSSPRTRQSLHTARYP